MEMKDLLKEIEALKQFNIKQEKKNQNYDQLFAQIHDFPKLVAEVVHCTEEINRLTKEISRFTKERSEDIDLLKAQLLEKEMQLKQMLARIELIREKQIEIINADTILEKTAGHDKIKR